MIDFKRKLVFLHIPRNGGSSIEAALLDHPELGEHGPGNNFRELVGSLGLLTHFVNGHRYATLAEHMQHLHSIGHNPYDYRYFTVVRHPVETVLSTARYHRRMDRQPDLQPTRDLIFRRTRTYASMINADAELHTLRFEHLEEDFASFMRKFYDEEIDLPHFNKTPEADDLVITPSVYKFITRHYAAECKLYKVFPEVIEDYVAVVTAKKENGRLPNKNILPFGDVTMLENSVAQARAAGLHVVISSDLPSAEDVAKRYDADLISELRGSHMADIDAAAELHPDKHLVVLQPTSPFRRDNIISKCIEAHRKHKGVVICEQKAYVHQPGEDTKLNSIDAVNGCVFIFEAGGKHFDAPVTRVPTSALNLLEVDVEADYIDACKLYVDTQHGGVPPLLPPHMLEKVHRSLSQAGFADDHYLVGRDMGYPIPQDKPTAYINHCRGYKKGYRVDAVFLIANAHALQERNWELVECLEKTPLVILRDHQYVKQLMDKYPVLRGKSVVVNRYTSRSVENVTTGAFAADILGRLAGKDATGRYGWGNDVERIVHFPIGSKHHKGGCYDIAILNTFGYNAGPPMPAILE